MIRYKDFVPRRVSQAGFFSAEEYESFDAALVECNAWVKENNINVLNIETVVLPNLWSPLEEGSADASIAISGEFASTWHQFIRCWYDA